MVWADRKLTPMPAITACLMVSVLLISIAIFKLRQCGRKPSSIEFQVSEPVLAHDEGLACSSRDTGMRLRSASGWSGAATIT